MPFGHFCKPRQLSPIARGGHDQCASVDEARIRGAPQRQSLAAQFAHERRRGLGFAVWRQHGAGVLACSCRERLGACLKQPHAMARARQRQRLPQAEDAGAGDRDVSRCHSGRPSNVPSSRLAGLRRSSASIPHRNAFAAGVGAAFEAAVASRDDVNAGVEEIRF